VLAAMGLAAAIALGPGAPQALGQSPADLPPNVELNDVNDRGQGVGFAFTASGQDARAVRWQDGKLTELATLGGSYSYAYDVNNLGQAVGVAFTPDGRGHAVLWQPDGAIITLGTLGGLYSSATHINDLGQITGYSLTSDGQQHAFVYQRGSMVDLSAVVGGEVTLTGIDELGQVSGVSETASGSQPFVWQDGLVSSPGQPDPISAAGLGNSSPGFLGALAPSGGLTNGASPAQTPELGSLALFGSGAMGVAGYALTRLRAGRRRR
jgi:probable HAF family extracellular repeat protein